VKINPFSLPIKLNLTFLFSSFKSHTTTIVKDTRNTDTNQSREKPRMQGELELPPGFRFHPTDDELVNHYLCRKCAAQSIAAAIIKEIDLYKFDPWQLPGI